MKNVLKVDEIFVSIQGESSFQGYPCVFIRLFGCNLSCAYCDTPQKEYTLMTVKQVYDKVREFEVSEPYLVCITGGEPLLQMKPLTKLVQKLTQEPPYYTVTLETNGTMVIPEEWEEKDFNVYYSIDVKMPSSGHKVNWKAIERNIKSHAVEYNSEFKFVVSNHKDVEFALSAMERIKSIYNDVYGETFDLYFFPRFSFSPVLDYKHMDAQLKFANWLAHHLVFNKIPARVCLQLHKIIGVK